MSEETPINHTDEEEQEENCAEKYGCESKLLPYQNYFFWHHARAGAAAPYFSLFYKQLGLTPWQIGLIAGVRPFAGFLGAPIWGCLSDKFNIQRRLLYMCIVGLALMFVGFAAVPPSPWTDQNCDSKGLKCITENTTITESTLHADLGNSSCHYRKPKESAVEQLLKIRNWMFESEGLHRIFITVFILSLVTKVLDVPAGSLADAEALQLLGSKEMHKYGFIRRPGSLALAIFSFSIGAILQHFKSTTILCGLPVPEVDYRIAFYTGVCCIILSGVSVAFFKKMPDTSSNDLSHGARKVQLHRAFSVFLSLHFGSWFVCVFIMGMCNGIVSAFLFWHIQNIGASHTLIGGANLVLHGSEIIFFSIAFKIRDLIGTNLTMMAGLSGYVVRFMVYANMNNPLWVLPMEVVQGFQATVWCILVSYLTSAIPHENKATMQGIIYGVYYGVGYGLGSIIGGRLVDSVGARHAFWIMCILSIANLVIFGVSQKVSKKPNPPDDPSDTEAIPLLKLNRTEYRQLWIESSMILE